MLNKLKHHKRVMGMMTYLILPKDVVEVGLRKFLFPKFLQRLAYLRNFQHLRLSKVSLVWLHQKLSR